MSFSVYLPKRPKQTETKTETFRRAVLNSGEFLRRIGRKVIKTGQIILWRNDKGDLCRVRIEGQTTDGNYLHGHGFFFAVREFRRTWSLRTEL